MLIRIVLQVKVLGLEWISSCHSSRFAERLLHVRTPPSFF